MRTMRTRFDSPAVLLGAATLIALGGCPSEGPTDDGPKLADVEPATAAPATTTTPAEADIVVVPPPVVAEAADASPTTAPPDGGVPANADATADALKLAAGFEEYRLDGICVALSGDGTYLAAGDLGGRVTVWDTKRKRLLIQETLPEGNRVNRVAFARSAPVLVSGAFQAPDAPFRVWQTQPAGQRHTIGNLHWQARELAIDDAGQRLLGLADVGAGTTRLVLWGIDDAEPIFTADFEGEHGFVSLSGDGGTAAAASLDGTLQIWRGTPMAVVATKRFENAKTLQRLLLSRDGRTLWGASGNQVFHYSLDPAPFFDRSVSIGGEGIVIRGLELLPDGRAVAVTRPDRGGVQLWDAANGRLLVDANGGCRCEDHALSADGLTLACDCVPDAVIRVWRIPTGP